MAYNGSGTFLINSTGQPVVSGTVISSTVENALTADLATGLSTCITKDAQTTTTAIIPFAAGIKTDILSPVTPNGPVSLTAGQLQFPASQNASSNANTLDDYEEGTFTPAITLGGGATGVTYASANGYYTKIGNRVEINGAIILSSKGSSTGAVVITGLPFTNVNETNNFALANVHVNPINGGTAIPIFGQVAPGGTTIPLSYSNAGTDTTLADTAIQNGTGFVFSLTIRTAT